MRKLRLGGALATLGLVLVTSGCAVRPTPDPRNPGPVRDGPVRMRVCVVEGDGAHASVGDQVEFLTNRLGRLRIRHIPLRGGTNEAWNGGDDVRIDSAVLVEVVTSDRNQSTARRFVPVGRFPVRVGGARGEHARFDFLVSKTTTPTREHQFPECIADVGDDEVLIRGVTDDDRHGGTVILR